MPAKLFTAGDERGEIDVRGEVLFPDLRQQVVADLVAMISAESSPWARGLKNLFGSGETIINGDKFAIADTGSSGAIKNFGGRTHFNGVTVRQHGEQFGSNFQFPIFNFQLLRQSCPDELFAMTTSHAPFEPFLRTSVPAKAVDGERVEKFVAKKDGGKI